MSGREVSTDTALTLHWVASGAGRRWLWIGATGGLVMWSFVRCLRWLWPLLVAPTTEEVCLHLRGMDTPLAAAAPSQAETSQEVCMSLVERRLRRRGPGEAARLRMCLGRAESLDAAAACQ